MISIILDDKTEEDLPFLAGVGITTSSYAVSQHNIKNSAPQSMEISCFGEKPEVDQI